jgi:DNA-binding response OmpR family regulator
MTAELDTARCHTVAARGARARLLLLILDPDPASAERLADQLRLYQIDVIVCSDAADALVRAGAMGPDAVLVAASITPMSGSTVARVLRERACIPTLVGVGAADGEEATAALAAGAHACVARPYRSLEILPLLRAISPDTAAELQINIEVGGLRLDPAAHEVFLHGRRIALPLREFQLLHLLMLHAGRVITRHQINQLVWAGDGDSSNTLNVHIRRLRARLGDDPKQPSIVVSVRGMGYRLDPP